MARWHSLLVALVMIAGGFFEQGCSSFMKDKAGDAMEGLWEKGKELVKNEVAAALPKLEDKLEEIAQRKLDEREKKDLGTIDGQLALLGTTDQTTGLTVTKRWQDFDSDHDGHLSTGEQLKIGAFISAEGFKRVQAGTMTKETFLGMEKTTGVALSSLLVGGTATAAIANRRKRNDPQPPQKPVAAGPPPPGPGPAAAAPQKPG